MSKKYLLIVGVFGLVLSSCAMHPLKGRGQQNLEDWDSSLVYDPITKRSYHTASVKSAQEAQRDAYIQDVIED